MSEGIQSNETSAFLTSDEWLLLQTLDPKKKLSDQLRLNMEQTMSDDIYKKQMILGMDDVTGIIPKSHNNIANVNGQPTENELDGYKEIFGGNDLFINDGSTKTGGFAFASLIPVATAVLPSLISLAAKGISSLVKKIRGKGIMPPGLRTARGVAPPRGGADAIITNYLKNNRSKLMDKENSLRGLRGRRFWKDLIQNATNELAHLVPQLTNVSSTNANTIARAAMNNIIPSSFQKFVSTSKDDKTTFNEKSPDTHIKSLVRPMVQWIAKKTLKGSGDPKMLRKMIDEASSHLDLKYGGANPKNIKAHKFWSKLKTSASRIAKEVLPRLAKGAKVALPSIIDAIMSQFKVSDQNKVAHQAIGEALKKGLPAALEPIATYNDPPPPSGKGTLEIDEEDDEIVGYGKKKKPIRQIKERPKGGRTGTGTKTIKFKVL